MFEASIREAQRLLQNATDKAHDIEHARRVAGNIQELATVLVHPQHELLVTCGWWHDVGRLIDNDTHELLSATLLKEDLLKRGASNEVAHKAYKAVRLHKWNMQPKTIEGHIVRDADKLDFISVERWQSCLDANQLEHLRDIEKLLPKLRDMLHFPESRDLYDKRIVQFQKANLTINL